MFTLRPYFSVYICVLPKNAVSDSNCMVLKGNIVSQSVVTRSGVAGCGRGLI
jgi:hypothetical protein